MHVATVYLKIHCLPIELISEYTRFCAFTFEMFVDTPVDDVPPPVPLTPPLDEEDASISNESSTYALVLSDTL